MKFFPIATYKTINNETRVTVYFGPTGKDGYTTEARAIAAARVAMGWRNPTIAAVQFENAAEASEYAKLMQNSI